jgi:hypothetical protein
MKTARIPSSRFVLHTRSIAGLVDYFLDYSFLPLAVNHSMQKRHFLAAFLMISSQ